LLNDMLDEARGHTARLVGRNAPTRPLETSLQGRGRS
jgi:hypothetical protein